jgi:inner membrane protein involved in colicin E2 resistance
MDDESIRAMVVGVGLFFWLAFAGMTAYVISEDGFTLLTGAAVLIVALTGVPLLSSFREPPRRR